MPSSPGSTDVAPSGPPAFADGKLSAAEAERFAATMRPSWELDEASFGPQGSPLVAAPRDVERRGPSPELLAEPRGLNGTHVDRASPAPRAASVSVESESSVILDPSILTPVPSLPPRLATSLTRNAPSRPPVASGVVARPSVEDEPFLAKPKKTGLWVGLACIVVLLVAAFAWLSSGGKDRGATPSGGATTAKSEPAAPHVVSNSAVSAATPAAPPPAVTLSARAPTISAPAAPPPAVVPVVPLPVALPPPAAAPTPRAAAWAPRPNSGPTSSPTPPPRPVLRPKGGNTTIVRDVPF